MAEIKSTLDLVMQRTRNLSFSREERDALRTDEFLKKLNGLIQRFEDGTLRLEEVSGDIGKLRQEYSDKEPAPVIGALLDRLDLDRDNRALLDLVQQVSGVQVAPIVALLQQFRNERDAARGQACEVALRLLADDDRISGSAVVAMPDGAPDWQARAAALRKSFARRLETVRQSVVKI